MLESEKGEITGESFFIRTSFNISNKVKELAALFYWIF